MVHPCSVVFVRLCIEYSVFYDLTAHTVEERRLLSRLCFAVWLSLVIHGGYSLLRRFYFFKVETFSMPTLSENVFAKNVI